MKLVKVVAIFTLCITGIGILSGVAAAVVLSSVFGFSLVPCQFDGSSCQVGPQVTPLPTAAPNLSNYRQMHGVSRFP